MSKTYPCDWMDDGHSYCPFDPDGNGYVSCRDCCGLGVDDDGPYDDEEEGECYD